MTTIREFDAARYLDDEETMAEYLAACLDDPNPDVFLAALGDVARARGMAQLAGIPVSAERACTRRFQRGQSRDSRRYGK